MRQPEPPLDHARLSSRLLPYRSHGEGIGGRGRAEVIFREKMSVEAPSDGGCSGESFD